MTSLTKQVINLAFFMLRLYASHGGDRAQEKEQEQEKEREDEQEQEQFFMFYSTLTSNWHIFITKQNVRKWKVY